MHRFTSLRVIRAQRATVHAANEHIGTDDFLDAIAWYRTLLEKLPN